VVADHLRRTALASADAAFTVVRTPRNVAARRIPVLGAHPYRPRAGDLPVPSGPVLRRTLELTGALIERSPPAVLGPLSPDQAADELLGYLRRHGHLPAGGSANAAGP
jgi:electron transfer flavoprotein beta subunit